MNIKYWQFLHRSRPSNNLRLPCKNRVALKFPLYWIYFLHSGFLTARPCPENRVSLKIFTVLNVFFTIQDFWATALALKYRVAQFIVLNTLLTFRSFEQLALALKNRGCPEFTVLNIYFLSFRIFKQLALALKKQSCPGIIHCTEYVFFIIQDFWGTSAPLKNIVTLKIFTVWNILFIFRNFEQLALALEKQSCPGVFNCIEYVFLSFRIFEQLALALKKQSCPENFHCIKYTSCIQEFWAICACPEKQRVSWIHCTEYVFFIIQDFWATCTCPEKTKLPWNFSLYWICIFYHSGFLSNLRMPWKTGLSWNFSLYRICIFYYSGFLSSLRLPWKRSLPWNFSNPGGGRLPDPPPRTPMYLVEVVCSYMCTAPLCAVSNS